MRRRYGIDCQGRKPHGGRPDTTCPHQLCASSVLVPASQVVPVRCGQLASGGGAALGSICWIIGLTPSHHCKGQFKQLARSSAASDFHRLSSLSQAIVECAHLLIMPCSAEGSHIQRRSQTRISTTNRCSPLHTAARLSL